MSNSNIKKTLARLEQLAESSANRKPLVLSTADIARRLGVETAEVERRLAAERRTPPYRRGPKVHFADGSLLVLALLKIGGRDA